ncbi:hemerythrin domain-containing protein [Amycolatopsis sp.]|jgi:hypothetical protein|uniref:hemerythrin domain-containing protein n=1 Tax=Amycolatopsis sp. TaxID=37632 RepID=UPI002E0811C4|nr:hemerythrin domain-containing protein [Amycolatopsis sp.]
MSDITKLILDDHDSFRRRFAALDDANGVDELRAIWEPLAAFLDLHAVAEEEVFYPNLLRRGDDAEDETVDAVGDHNDIRDAVHEAERHPIDSDEWWKAVHDARMANSEHMAEEEDEALADFRRNASAELRDDLGRRFAEFKKAHPGARDLDTGDKDPQGYVNEVEAGFEGHSEGSLGIGSLKGQ